MLDTFWNGVAQAAAAMSLLEIVAVVLGVLYLLLAMKQNNLCWYAAFSSSAISSWLFWDVNLYMEAGLYVFYVLMAVYGWWVWRNGGNQHSQQLPVQTWTINKHVAAMGLIVGLALVSGYLLDNHTEAALPYLDSFTTWGAVVTTYMVARKVLENWLYWQVFNTGAIILYIDRELYLYAALMFVYLILAVIGWFMWRSDYEVQKEVQKMNTTASAA